VFTSFLRKEVERLALPGLAVSIRERGQERFAAGFGYCDPTIQRPITPDTQFGVASVSKLVTAIEILRLQEQKRLSVYDSISRYYPKLNIAADARMQIHHLLSHSTGLPGLPSRFFAVNLQNEDDASGGIDFSRSNKINSKLPTHTTLLKATDLSEFINTIGVTPLASPGALLNYSNESFCLLGGIIEMIATEPYQQHIVNSIFKPLDMTQSFVGYDTIHDDNIALPLTRNDDALCVAGIWDAPLFYPAGGVISSARDLTQLLNVLSDDNGFLSETSRQLLRQCAIGVASRPDTSIGYGYALEYQLLDNDTVLHWHTGQRTGISSFIAWVSGSDIAVSVLSHIANAPVAEIGFGLIAKLLDRADIIWPPLSNRLTSNTNNPSSSEIIQLQGRYISNEGFDYRVEMMDSTLFASTDDHTTRTPLHFINKSSGIIGEQNFRFLKHQETDIIPWALALDLRILPLRDNN